MDIRSLLSTLSSVLFGFLAGVITVQIVAPDLLTDGMTERDELPDEVTARLAGVGEFEPIDSVRKATGRVQLLEGRRISLLRFTEFEVTGGPDLRVWLSAAEPTTDRAAVRAADVIDVGPVFAVSGDQTYVLPVGIDLSRVQSILIWSAEARTLYGVAGLTRSES